MAGIVGYGAYIPRNRIKVEEIAKVWGADAPSYKKGLMLEEKSVPAPDQDTITMSVEAREARPQAGRDRPRRDRRHLRRLGVASLRGQAERARSWPRRSARRPSVHCADFEFACKAGTEGMFVALEPGQGRARSSTRWPSAPTPRRARPATRSSTPPRPAPRPSSSAGRSSSPRSCETYSYMTDTPDFWRREYQYYPRHGGRFTGEPAYFKHVLGRRPRHHGEGRA